MLGVDTSVLVYATGTDHPLREPAIRLLRDITAQKTHATTTPEVLVLAALRLWSSTPAIGAFDAVLASIALARDWSVVSSDKGFGRVAGLNWVDLAAY